MSNVWKDAVLDALVINWQLTSEHKGDPRKAVADLVRGEVAQALDPLVSQSAQLLINERDSQWRDAVLDACQGMKDVANEILNDMGVVEG